MHIDFVEEAYWKRVVALKLAIECKNATKQRKKQRIVHLSSPFITHQPDFARLRLEEVVNTVEKPVIEQKAPTIQIGGFDLDDISVKSEEDYNCPDQPDSQMI